MHVKGGRVPVLLLIGLVACGGSDPVTKALPPAPVVTIVSVTPSTASVEVGSASPFVADVRDQNGAAITGQAVSWTSASPNVAQVNVSTGVATGIAPGTALISATIGGKTGSATLTVIPAPVASIAIGGAGGSLTANQTVQLSAVTKDRAGIVLTGRAIAWTSSAIAVATVDNAGKVTAIGGGSATITASSEGIATTTTIVVTGPASVLPTISGIAPATLTPGTLAILTGVGFDVFAANDVVTLRGIALPVVSATSTQLTVSVPCLNQGSADVQVTANSVKGPAFSSTVAVPQRSLAIGQAVVLPDVSCNELAPVTGTARYIVSVFSAASSENTLVDFELDGNPASVVALAGNPVAAQTGAALAPGPDAARDRAHFAHLERNRADYLEGRRLMSRLPVQSRLPAAAVVPIAGDTRDFYMTFSTTCNDTTQKMHGKVLYVGSRAIVWEDSTNALLAANDPALAGYYQHLGAIFDLDQYDVIKTNFGDPLRRDAVTDNDGHINMVFSDRLNNTGAAAYVSSCDQYPTTVFKGSNFGQVFYGFTPTTKGSNLSSTLFPDGWFTFMGRTVVHEVKHIASLSARVATNAPVFEESWLEEGTARHAEELWVRQLLQKVAWKANTGFGTAATNGIFCDFHPENTTCNSADTLRRPSYGMRRHFNEIRNKLVQPWAWSIYGDGTGQTGSVFYQTTWSLVRYAIDRYGTSDASFLTTLTSSSGAGLANLASIAGVSSDQLIGLWTLSLYADDYPGLANPSPDIQFPTWNLRSIYAGLNTDLTWGSTYTTPFPIAPVALSFGSFASQRRNMRGGANAYFEIQGTSVGGQLLNVRAIGGGAASPNLRIAIARLQ